MLSQISRDQYYCKVSAEKIRLFTLWYDAVVIPKTEDPMDYDEDTPSIRGSYAVQRSKKIVFNPSEELPLLRASFENEPHPSSQRMTELVLELNETGFRKTPGREKVDFRHVNNWFKNERARVRKCNQEFSQVTYRTEYGKLEPGTGDEPVLLAIEHTEENGESEGTNQGRC